MPMTNLYQTISKEEINTMPRALFEGKIIVVSTESETKRVCSFLSQQSMVGIDTETKPSFHKGVTHKVALLQVSTDDICFLFRLNFMGLCPPLCEFLASKKTLKVGLSLHDDILSLHRRGDFATGSYIDIQDLAPRFGIKDMSLQKIYANLFGKKISKSQRLSNWEADVLSEAQKRYAATDAWACTQIYRKLKALHEQHDYVLIENYDQQQEHNTKA